MSDYTETPWFSSVLGWNVTQVGVDLQKEGSIHFNGVTFLCIFVLTDRAALSPEAEDE